MINIIHIMLDLETWGTEPGSDIRSIGACVFDPMTGYVADARNGGKEFSQSFYIATDNPLQPDPTSATPVNRQGEKGWYDGNGAYRRWNLRRDPNTVQWWSEQSAEAQAAFDDAVPLNEACRRFAEWMITTCGQPGDPKPPTVRLWSHGAHFDGPILAAVYAACGQVVPWHYRAPRDTRTAFDMAGIEDHSEWLTQFNTGTAHLALDDAIAQAKAVCAAYEIVNGWRTVSDASYVHGGL